MLDGATPIGAAFSPAAVVAAPRTELVTIKFVSKAPPVACLRQVVPQRKPSQSSHGHEADRMTGRIYLDGVAPDFLDLRLFDPGDRALTAGLEVRQHDPPVRR